MDSTDPSEEGQSAGTLLRELLRDRRVVGALVAFVILFVLVVSLGGGSDDPEPTATDTTPITGATTTTSAQIDVGHQIPPIDGCTLLSDEEVLSSLGVSENTSVIRFSGGEGCLWQPDDGSELSIQLRPGDPGDFADAAVVDGVEGESVPDVGEAAVWFGGDEVGTLSAVRPTALGYLFMKLTISRADVTDEQRLDIAGVLLTSAMDTVEFGPPPTVEVDLCELVTDDEAEELLAPHREGRAAARDAVFVTDDAPGLVDLNQTDQFNCSKLILAEIYVRVESGGHDLLDEGANLDGVMGEPVTGIGDRAMFFEKVPFRSSFSAPHEIDVLVVGWQDAVFSVVISLPDLQPEAQFAAVRSLAGKALGRIPGGPGAVTTFIDESPDLSALGFVENLLARETAGTWSREEGLIATLQLFAGETDSNAVLDQAELLDRSGTGIIALAQEYLETEADTPGRQEIARLLDLLIVPLGPAPEPEVSTTLTVMLGDLLSPGLIAQTDDETDLGYAAPPEIPGGFDYPEPDYTPGECATQEPVVPGWEPSGFEVPDAGPWTGAVLFPSEGSEGGWMRETHLLWALQALTDTAQKLGAPPVCIRMLFTQQGGSYTFVEQKLNPSLCGIFINRPMQNRNPDHFRQQLAADIAHCYFPKAFPNQWDVDYRMRRWWNHALAEFLSNVVYPGVNLEWRLSPSMSAQETSLPLVLRDAGNWMFFQELVNVVGLEGIAVVMNALPGGNDAYLDEFALADLQEMNEFYHSFSQQLTDAAVADTGGGTIPYDPKAREIALSDREIFIEETLPFLAVRWHVTVEPGKYACMSSLSSDETLVSYRPGAPGSSGSGGWMRLPEDETAYSDDLTLIATSVEDGQFSLEVRDVHEESDCEDEEEPPDPPESKKPDEPCECDPSAYFLIWQDIPDLLKQVLTPPGG